MALRIGQGWDTHQLVEGFPLIIGGEKIPYARGSKGHSDGDVIFHALVDALLGAAALGDIGHHFPSSDEQWKNADSSLFLKHVQKLITEKSLSVVNVDCTVILQEPHISAHVPRMRRNVASFLGLDLDQVSIKATTTDHLGFMGRGEGISATAIVLLNEADQK